ncbi:MAG: hypothetical protein ACYDED_14470 [Ferrimicrobium sp.]
MPGKVNNELPKIAPLDPTAARVQSLKILKPPALPLGPFLVLEKVEDSLDRFGLDLADSVKRIRRFFGLGSSVLASLLISVIVSS